MKLHTDKKLFRDAVSITAQQMNIPTIYVEKDYWVTFALKSIFSKEVGADTIFKGGTSLAKCFKMINRFSEDIDLVVIRREGETDNKLKRKLKDVEKAINDTLPEIEIQGLTHKVANDDVKSFRNNNQWLVHHPNQSLMFKDLANVWSQLETTYNGSFRDLVYGNFPNSDVVPHTLDKIRERMTAINWTIKP